MADDKLALVLSGGGARGAFGAGVVDALAERGIQPEIISGTSAGGITGATLAMGWSMDRMIELWTSLESRDVYTPRLDLHELIDIHELPTDPREWLGIGGRTTSDTLLEMFRWTWLFDLAPLRELLVDEIGGEQLTLRDGVTLTLSTVEVATGIVRRFSNTALPTPERDDEQNVVGELDVDHVLASASIPGLFRPIEIDGHDYWDGGLTSNTPLNAALAHDPDRVLVVGASPESPEVTPPESFGDVLALALDHVLRSALYRDVDHARTVNELSAAAPDATFHREVQIEVLVPEHPISGLGDLLDFEPSVAERLVEQGRRVAVERLAELDWV